MFFQDLDCLLAADGREVVEKLIKCKPCGKVIE